MGNDWGTRLDLRSAWYAAVGDLRRMNGSTKGTADHLLLSRPRRWPGRTPLPGVTALADVSCSFSRYESPCGRASPAGSAPTQAQKRAHAALASRRRSLVAALYQWIGSAYQSSVATTEDLGGTLID